MNNLEFTTLTTYNPVTLILEIEKNIQLGFVPYLTHQYGGFECFNGLYSLNLFKVQLDFEPVVGCVYEINTFSDIEFINKLSAAVRSGFKVVESSVQWDSLHLKQCRLVNMNDSINTITDKEQLNELTWDDLKQFGDSLGVERNRLRTAYTTQIIKSLNQRRKLLGLEVFVE